VTAQTKGIFPFTSVKKKLKSPNLIVVLHKFERSLFLTEDGFSAFKNIVQIRSLDITERINGKMEG